MSLRPGIFKSVILLLSVFFLTSCNTHKVSNRNTDPLFVNDPVLQTGTLENGLQYYIMKNTKPLDRVSMHLVIRVGSIDETEEEQGLAHYLEHMLFNGSENFPPGELVKFFQSIGMDFGGDANASTGFYKTVYDVMLPKGDEKNLSDGLLVLKDYATGALILESEVDRERSIILAEKRDRDSAGYRLLVKTLKFELGEMRLPERFPIGTVECIEKADRKRLKHFYDTWYRPDNMFIVVVGDLEPTLVEGMIKENFSRIAARAPQAVRSEPGTVDHTGIKFFHHYEEELGKTSVTIETLEDTPIIPDSVEFRKEKLVLAMAHTILGNRLNIMTKKPETPFTSARANAGIYLRHIRSADISADCSPENWAASLALIEKTLRAALEYGFYPEELEQVKSELVAGLEKAVKSAATRESNMLARQIISAVGNDKRFLSPASKLQLFRPFIQALTIKDVNQALRTAWQSDHRLVLVTGNADLKKNAKEPIRQIADIYNKSTAVSVSKPQKEKKVQFPYLPKPDQKGAIQSKKEYPDLGITTIDYQNGLRLHLKKTDFKANQVLFSVIFGYGKKSEPEAHPGLAELSASLLNESGFGTLTRDELKRALAGKSTRIRFGIDSERFRISGIGVTDEAELMFQLIRTQLIDPGFRKDIYDLIIERTAQSYKEMEKTVEGANLLHAKSFWTGGDSRFGMPDFKTYSANQPADVKAWIEEAFNHNQLEVSIVGDIDTDAVIEACTTWLGSIPGNRKPFSRTKQFRMGSPVFPTGDSLSLSVKTNIPKSHIEISWRTDDFWNIHRTRRLSALGTVFTNRLTDTIREELGAAYSTRAGNISSVAYPGYGRFTVIVPVEPGKEPIVIEKIHEIAEKLRTETIPADELERAIGPTLTYIKDLRKTNEYWLNSVMEGASRYPEKFDWPNSIVADYQSITPEEIRQLAQTYLRPDMAATVRIATQNR